MRMSASGLESTIAVAIDQILRLAPSIRAPIEPVVSSTNATSTAGFSTADDRLDDSDRAARARAKADGAMRGIVGSPSSVLSLGSRVPLGFAVHRGHKKGWLRTNLWPASRRTWQRCFVVATKSDTVRYGITRPP